MVMSPTQRTLKHYKSLGFPCAITEKWNPFARIRQDLFGFIDLVVLAGDNLYAIQTTSASNKAARLNKICALPNAKKWLEAGGKIKLITWGKHKKKRGGKAYTWVMGDEFITLDTINAWKPPQVETETNIMELQDGKEMQEKTS